MKKSLSISLMGFAFLVIHSPASASGSSRTEVNARLEIFLRVYDYAGLQTSVLNRAMDHVRSILGEAGVDVAPVFCTPGKSPAVCTQPPDALNIDLRIVPKPLPGFRERSLGYAAGSDITVTYPQVEQVAGQAGVLTDRLLGCVVAHEMGHVLLGPNSHSARGIMMELWTEDELAQVRGTLVGFLPFQRERIRAYVLAHSGKARTVSAAFTPQQRAEGLRRIP